MSLISVLMPVRNGALHIREAIDSILAQTFEQFELVVIDDGSDDGTADIIEKLAARDARVRVLRRPFQGLVAALESGRGIARGEFIARMDADDVAYPHRLQRQVTLMEARPGLAAVGSQSTIIDGHGRPIGKGRYPLTDRDCRDHLALASPFCHPAVMMRAAMLGQAGGYRERFSAAEDYDLWLRIAHFGELANDASPLIKYRVHNTNRTQTNGRANACASALALMEERHGARSVQDALDVASVADWTTIEKALAEPYRLQARAAYLRTLAVAGNLTQSSSDAQLLLGSASAIVAKAQDRKERRPLAFTLLRACALSFMAGQRRLAFNFAVAALRSCPKEFLAETLNSASRRWRSSRTAPNEV